jgi:hypothetical protein
MIARAYLGNGNVADNLATTVAKRFGGSTTLNGVGRWYDDDGTLYFESSWIVEVIVKDYLNVMDFKHMAQESLEGSGEKSVLVTWVSGGHEFIENHKIGARTR